MGLYYNLKKSLVRTVVDLSLDILSDSKSATFPNLPTPNQIHYDSSQSKLYRYNYSLSSWEELPLDTLYFDLDSHANEQKLPDNSFLTTKMFSVSVDEHIVSVQCLVGVAILDDTNLVKHDLVLDTLFSNFLPTKKVKIYDMVSNVQIGIMQVKNDVDVLPMHHANQRPIQFIGVELVANLGVDLTMV